MLMRATMRRWVFPQGTSSSTALIVKMASRMSTYLCSMAKRDDQRVTLDLIGLRFVARASDNDGAGLNLIDLILILTQIQMNREVKSVTSAAQQRDIQSRRDALIGCAIVSHDKADHFEYLAVQAQAPLHQGRPCWTERRGVDASHHGACRPPTGQGSGASDSSSRQTSD